MAIMMKREEDKNEELTRRINADLRVKVQAPKDVENEIDFAENSEYVKDFKKTGKFAWVWVVIIAISAIIFIIYGQQFSH